MTYNWDLYKETCRRLRVDEHRSVTYILECLERQYGIHPSKRALLRRLAEWKFSNSTSQVEYTEALVARVKQLWESNLTQDEMAKALNDEGYDIKPLALARLRRRKGFYMSGNPVRRQGLPDIHFDEPENADEELEDDVLEQGRSQRKKNDLRIRKQRRKATVFQSSTDNQPTRYPSEMTVAEAKSVLNIDESSFKVIRSTFSNICEQHGITKKSIAGQQKWELAKTILTEGTPLLRDAFWSNADNTEAKKLSLDTLCMSIMRATHYRESYIKVAGVKNALGADPQQTRELRQTFHEVLYEHGIVQKTGALPNWDGLKHEWAAKCVFMKNIIDNENQGPQGKQREQLAEKFARDILKRLRDQLRQKAKAQDTSAQQPSTTAEFQDEYTHAEFDLSGQQPDINTAQLTPVPTQSQHQLRRLPARAAKQTSTTPTMSYQPILNTSNYIAFPSAPMSNTRVTRYASGPTLLQPAQQQPCAVYMRLHPASNFTLANSLWIAAIPALDMNNIRAGAVAKFPGAICGLVEGVVKDGVGGEMPLRVQDDEELSAYISHLQGASPTFNVQILQT